MFRIKRSVPKRVNTLDCRNATIFCDLIVLDKLQEMEKLKNYRHGIYPNFFRFCLFNTIYNIFFFYQIKNVFSHESIILQIEWFYEMSVFVNVFVNFVLSITSFWLSKPQINFLLNWNELTVDQMNFTARRYKITLSIIQARLCLYNGAHLDLITRFYDPLLTANKIYRN